MAENWLGFITSILTVALFQEMGNEKNKYLTSKKFTCRKPSFIFIMLTCNMKSIFLSRTSSAKWFLILEAGSNSMWLSVSLSCNGREKRDWSQWKASFHCLQTILLPPIFKHLGFFDRLLFSMLLRIFLKLCYKIQEIYL